MYSALTHSLNSVVRCIKIQRRPLNLDIYGEDEIVADVLGKNWMECLIIING